MVGAKIRCSFLISVRFGLGYWSFLQGGSRRFEPVIAH